MATQHSDILHAECHEPRHITNATTSDAGKIITPSSSTSGASTLRQLKASELDLSGQGSIFTYWAVYDDNTYTNASRQAIASSTRTKITIDGLGGDNDTNQLPGGVSLWDTSSNTITPVAENDAYNIRLDLNVEDATSGDHIDFELDVGGAVGVIITETKSIIKSGAAFAITVNWSFSVDSVFNTNGGEIYITPSAAIEAWDYKLFINKTHAGA